MIKLALTDKYQEVLEFSINKSQDELLIEVELSNEPEPDESRLHDYYLTIQQARMLLQYLQTELGDENGKA